jgi:hypothetical protein
MTTTTPAIPTRAQAVSSLAELAERFRKAQADFLQAASNAVLHAINAGRTLIAAKELTPHGQWGKWQIRLASRI